MDYLKKFLHKESLHIEKTKKMLNGMYRLRVRKMHLDYLAGILSIPVLVTAIILNFNSLNKNKVQVSTVSPTPQVIVVSVPPTKQNPVPTTTSQVCQKSIGPISITYPQEGLTIADNPVCITIDYSNPNYCSVVWSYRVNSGTWSDYNSNTPCIYNIPNGSIQFQLRVNSTVTNQQEVLTRNFTYAGANNVVISPTPTETPVPTFSPTPIASNSALGK